MLSFHAVKNLTTAEGGAVVWRDVPGLDHDDLYQKYMLYSLHGQSGRLSKAQKARGSTTSCSQDTNAT